MSRFLPLFSSSGVRQWLSSHGHLSDAPPHSCKKAKRPTTNARQTPARTVPNFGRGFAGYSKCINWPHVAEVAPKEDGGQQANGFQLLERTASFSETEFIYGEPRLKKQPQCDPSHLSSKQRFGLGLQLGLSRAAVVAVLGQPTREEASRLVYETARVIKLRRDGGPPPDEEWTQWESLVVSLAQERVVAFSGLRITRN